MLIGLVDEILNLEFPGQIHSEKMGSLSTLPDFDAPFMKVLSPSILAHVVLRTGNFRKMVDFYTSFLGGTITYGNDFLAFITYDEEHHRIAIIAVPGTGPKQPLSSGLEHIAFAFPDMVSLLLSYRQRKAKGINPVWAVNHGPTTSLYYKDPDGNMLETQVDNFDTVDAANEFMNSEYFAENPIGTDVDPEGLIRRIKGGENEVDLKRRVEIGPRELPSLENI
jgi:catechol-2,3-dioxygenase